MADWIIPLGTGSISNNDEIRLLLRSIERHAQNLGRVVVVGDAIPEWLTNVEIVKRGDPLPANKDGNIIDKVLTACKELDIKSFVFSADDNIILQDVDCDDIPILRTTRTQEDFMPKVEAGKIDWNRWRQRVFHTFWLAQELGCPMQYDFESHAPQLYKDSAILIDGMRKIKYHSGLGYTICSAFRICEGLAQGKPVEGMPHKDCKITWEDKDKIAAPKKQHIFGGYNDSAFVSGVKDWLFAIYPQPSKFEIDGGIAVYDKR